MKRCETGKALLLAMFLVSIASSDGAASEFRDRVARDARERAAIASPFQRTILSDGQVDRREYERATDQMVDCLRHQPVGLEVTDPVVGPTGELDFTITLAAAPGGHLSEQTERRAKRAYEQCERRFMNHVGTVYSNQGVVADEDRPAELRRLTECLEHAGLRLPGPLPLEELSAAIGSHPTPEVASCAERHINYFRLPSFVSR